MSSPKVTIAIPVYNGSNYLADAIESALAQDYSDIEIIVVNDGSDDNGATESIAHRYLPRITYIAQENTGVGGAMNAALRAMTGEVFTWLSHDDLFLPHKTSAQVAYHRRLRKPDPILFSNYHRIDASGAITHTSRYSVREFMNNPMLPLLQGAINGCTLYVPAHILREFGPFDEKLRFAQDYDLWNKILTKYDFLLQADVLVKYRVHAGQGTHKPGFVSEGDALWTRMLDSRSPAARAQVAGSTKRFFASRAAFLERTPFKEAARRAAARADSAVRETLVSVVLPFADEEGDVVIRAARGVLAQSHPELQLILVDFGSAPRGGSVRDAIGSDRPVVLVRAERASVNDARNQGMLAADGEYIAFLSPRDLFAPDKIARQVESMQERGAVMSHTSYEVVRPEAPSAPGIVRAGTLSGQIYPRILSECPIACSTVMLHSSLVGGGFRFDPDHAHGEALSWMWIACRHEIDALDDALSTIEWSDRNGAATLTEQARRAAWILEEVRSDALHSRHRAEISALGRTVRALALSAAEGDRGRTWQANLTTPESYLNGLPLSAVFGREGNTGQPARSDSDELEGPAALPWE